MSIAPASASATASPAVARCAADAARVLADPRLAALLRQGLPQASGTASVGWPITAVAPDDPMLLHSLQHHRDGAAAVSQYLNVALQQHAMLHQVLERLFPQAETSVSLLDLGCGHGRLQRFLCAGPRALQRWVADVRADATDFVAQHFGAQVLTAAVEPSAFGGDQRFDLIWVASLFSHLPADALRKWLHRLPALLHPGGVLCFSVHGAALCPPGQDMPASGLLYQAVSEVNDLPSGEYGTTHVSDAWVRAALADAGIAPQAVFHLPRALAHEEDLYIVAHHADRLDALRGPHGLRRGPWGWVDERRVDGRTLHLSGWCASLDEAPAPELVVTVGNQRLAASRGLPRADVAQVLGDPRLADAGWSLDLELPDTDTQPWVTVTARDDGGRQALLYAGWPGGEPVAPLSTGHVYRRDIDPQARSSLSVIAARVRDGERVLDLGTGTGAFGRLLSARGCHVDGLTLSEAERVAAGDGYARLEVMDLERADWADAWPPAAYDVVVCADVLEHLRNPEAVMRACHGLLRPGGRLLVSIPNAAYAGMVVDLMHGNWRYGAEGLLDRTHLRFFTRRSFTQALADSGWQAERVEPIDSSWYLTEFWTPFDRLPPAVALHLLAQPDASAYQLVFEARATGTTGEVTVSGHALPRNDSAQHVAVFASLAVAAGADGREVQVSAMGRVGMARQTLRFTLPADARVHDELRWYPADRPGYLHLHALSLLDANGHERWHWLADEGAARLRPLLWQHVAPGDGVLADGSLPLLLQADAPALRWTPAQLPADLGPGPWTLQVDCGWPLSADYLALRDALLGAPAPRDPTVEVVVPVYGHLDGVQRCLASVLAGGGSVPWHLTVIDDASPSPEVNRWLVDWAAAHPQCTLVTNGRNLGFVGTVNLGMRLAAQRDVVLLNSDTEVPPGWLDRLHAAAYRGTRIGTVTPFSNNATICSYPRFCESNELPPGHDTASLDRVFASALAGQSVDVPTAVGFCMYIRHDCLRETGWFDAETFGAGYGEENDFCLRATARGWRHVHAFDLFVYHQGGASFSTRQQALQAQALAAIRRLHPGYEDLVRAYVAADPAAAARAAIDRALSQAASPRA